MGAVCFSLAERGWVEAGELRVGAALLVADGTTGTLEAVAVIDAPQTMYNLTIEWVATYLVGDGQWVVHNTFIDRLSNLDDAIRFFWYERVNNFAQRDDQLKQLLDQWQEMYHQGGLNPYDVEAVQRELVNLGYYDLGVQGQQARRFVGSTEYRNVRRRDPLRFDPRIGNAIPATVTNVTPSQRLRGRGGIRAAEFYYDFDLEGKVILSQTGSSNIPEIRILSDINPGDIRVHGRCPR